MAASFTMGPVLRALLDTGAGFGPLDHHGNPSQYCAGLLALARLGADDAALNAFMAQQDACMQPAPDVAPWPLGDAWTDGLGKAQAWAPYRDLMGQWLFYEDAGDVLRQILPRLMQGCAGAGFAGLIRTAYALQAQHRQELVDALAYWASAHMALPSAHAAHGSALSGGDPEQALRRLHAVPVGARGLGKALQAAASDGVFQAAVAMFTLEKQTLPQLSRLAAQACAASGMPLAAQLLTSTYALGVVLPFVDEDVVSLVLQDYWRAFAAVVCVAGLRDAPPPEPRSWRAILAQVRECRDPRVICLVDSCRVLEKAHGADPLWRQAATRALWP